MQGDKSQLLYLKDNSSKYHFCVYVYAASVQNNAAAGGRAWLRRNFCGICSCLMDSVFADVYCVFFHVSNIVLNM
uniref:Macaca fascicularis brain cDNA, clone: QflA-16036 n=1 Tax=Macaca fascicularis TaxID=9541 RepID=I7G4W1_MACFA|nr:unnamed protein product [Macaca fascicularis]